MKTEIIELTNSVVKDVLGIDLSTYQEFENITTDKHELYQIVKEILKNLEQK